MLPSSIVAIPPEGTVKLRLILRFLRQNSQTPEPRINNLGVAVGGQIANEWPKLTIPVADKGYHSNQVLQDLAHLDIRTWISEPDRGRRNWKSKEAVRQAVLCVVKTP